MKYYFPIKDAPPFHTLWTWIERNTDICKYYDLKPSRNYFVKENKSVLELDHAVDISSLSRSTQTILNEVGFRGWISSSGESRYTGGFSLVYNPEHSESLPPEQSTLGTRKNLPDQFYWNQTQNCDTTRNSYFDSLAFRKLTQPARTGVLGEFLSGFKRSMIRSRCGVIDARYTDPKRVHCSGAA